MGIACDHVNLDLTQTLPSTALDVQEICAEPPIASDAIIKVLFLIDTSGSNCTQNGIPPACDSSGTDPDKSYRLGLMQNFVSSHISQPNISYGAITFSGTVALPMITDGSGKAIFTNSASIVNTGFDAFKNLKDTGATPYKAALKLAKETIQDDITQSTKAANYFVVLVSDGMPTDYGLPIDQNQINADVKTLVELGPRITVSGIYYNPLNVTQDAAVIQSIVGAGGGGYSNTNIEGKNVPLEQIISLSNSYPWVITRMMVSNLNAAPCDDGTIDADSDADGICDKDELKYNQSFSHDSVLGPRMNGKMFDPQNRNSFVASYGDLFYLRKIAYNQLLDPGCLLTGDNLKDVPSRDLLNFCEKQFMASKTPAGPTPLWTSAMKNNADPFNFDSDGDGIIDWLEFEFSRNPATAMDYNSTHTEYQGFTMNDIITQHRNTLNPKSSSAYDGVFKFARINEKGQNCYSYGQSVLPLYPTLPVTKAQVSNIVNLAHDKNQNVILIYVIEKPENALESPGVLRYYYQKVDTSVVRVQLQLDLSKYGTYYPDFSKVSMALKAADGQ